MSNNRSAFEAIPGRDALLEYQSKAYPAKTYVERNGLVYKSLTGTSPTFISSQWELVSDLREVRVPNIPSRNALTGNTPTTGTTGIRIPILDNTNVLVIDAFDDPQVAAHKFARYNYNQTLASWLLLQAGTGATNSNVNDYNLLINKKPIVSGVTVTAGAGLSGGGSVFGTAISPFAAGGNINISHADTSSLANINNSGYAYVQKLNFDTYGHVTGGTSSTWTHPTGLTQNIINTGKTYVQSINVSNGHVTSVSSSAWIHPDTSSQASSINAGTTFIQSVYLDGDGHVTGIDTATVPTGGAGFNFKINGNSGGALTVASGGTLTISGGTNILTSRTGSATNPGVRVSVVPAGANTYVQYNNSGVLGGQANFNFDSAGGTLSVPFVTLSSVPASGTTGDQFLTRSAGGAIQRLGFNTIANALAATPLNSVQLRGASGFVSSSNFTFTGGTTVVAPILALTTTPSAGGSDDILTWNATSKLVKKITQASLVTPPAGSTTQLQFNNSGVFGASSNLTFTGSTTLVSTALALTNTPSAGGSDDILTWNAVSKKVTKITQASLGSAPAGSNTQVQFNNGGAFGASGNLTFNSGTNTLSSINVSVGTLLNIGSAPAAGGASDTILVRDTVTGNVRQVAQDTANNGINKVGTNFRLGGALTGNTTVGVGTFNMTFNTNAFTFGDRLAGVIGSQSFSAGSSNVSSGGTSFVGGGSGNVAGNQYAATIGGSSIKALNAFSVAIGGSSNTVNGNGSIVLGGIGNTVSGYYAMGGGQYTATLSDGSIAFGLGDSIKLLTASGQASFNFSRNDSSQTTGHGALAPQSAILGGINHNIDSSNTRAAIIGGNAIKLPAGGAYVDHVAVANLAVFTAPTAGAAGTDDVLVWNATDKKVKKLAQGSLAVSASLAANHNNIVYVSATLGSDATGAINNISKPYATITAAITAANGIGSRSSQNRVLVYILPGIYPITSTISMQNYIDLYLCPSATITGSISASLFQWNNVDANILGFGNLAYSPSSSNSALNFTNQGTLSCTIRFNSVTISSSSSGYFIYDNSTTNNKIIMYIDKIIMSSTSTFAFLAQGAGNTSEYHLDFVDWVHTGNPTLATIVQLSTGSHKMFMRGNKLSLPSFTSSVFMQCYVGTSYVYIKECNISRALVDVENNANFKFGGKIIHTASDFLCAMYIGTNTGSIYIEPGTVITTPSTNSINAGVAGSNLYIYGNMYTNKAVAANVTTNLGTVTVTALPLV